MNDTSFIPFRGLDEKLQERPYRDGAIYFATDTGKIYLDAQNQNKIPIGGSGAKLLYANSQSINSDASNNYLITHDMIEGLEPMKPSDLIINSDGRFFKVKYLMNTDGDAMCELLAVSGTGGSGGGTGGGGSGLYTITCEAVSPFPQIFLYNSRKIITFKIMASGDMMVSVTCSIIGPAINGVPQTWSQTFYNVPARTDEHEIEIGSHLFEGKNKVEITVQGDNSGTFTKTFTNREAVTLSLTDPLEVTGFLNSRNTFFKYDADIVPTCRITGGSLVKTLRCYVDSLDSEPVKCFNDGLADYYQTTEAVKEVSARLDNTLLGSGKHTIYFTLEAALGEATITAPPLAYEVARQFGPDEVQTTLVWLGDLPEEIENYTELSLPFRVYDPKATQGQGVPVYIYKDDTLLTTLNVDATGGENDDWFYWPITYDAPAVQDQRLVNRYTIMCNTASEQFKLTVVGSSRNLSIVENGLIVNLSAKGRTNNAASTERTTWKTGKSARAKNVNFVEKFNWKTNGWLSDDTNSESYLRLTNGAKIEVPIDLESIVGDSSPNKAGAIEIRFRIRNIKDYSTLIQNVTNVIGTNDYGYEIVEVTKEITTDENKIWGSFFNEDGFQLGTQETYFRIGGNTLSAKYKEDEVISLSYVINNDTIFIYLNGILSGILAYQRSKIGALPNKFIIRSDICDVDIYSIRAYDVNFSMLNVIQNYLADQKSLTLYDQNMNLLTTNESGTYLDYNKLLAYNETVLEAIDAANTDAEKRTLSRQLSMPYMVLTSEHKLDNDEKTALNSNDDRLPYFKGNSKFMTVEFHNVYSDYKLAANEITEYDYYTHCPSFKATGVSLNVQGTSSQGYPRRNYKAKFKSSKDKWVYYNDNPEGKQGSLANLPINVNNTLPTGQTVTKNWHMDSINCATNKFTWKIDYMESSGSYNTGFANLASTLYSKHPLAYYDNLLTVEDANKYRTTVYGFPVLVFHKHTRNESFNTGSDDGILPPDTSYEYIGRYNFNLDKGSNEYFGFEDSHTQIYDPEGRSIKDVSECWELSNNQGTWTSFIFPMKADGVTPETDFTVLAEADTEGGAQTLEVTKHFEYRYNVEGDQIESALGDAGADPWEETGIDLTPNEFLIKKYSHLEKVFQWLDSTNPNRATGAPLTAEQIANAGDYIKTLKFQSSGTTGISKEVDDETTITIGANKILYKPDDEDWYIPVCAAEKLELLYEDGANLGTIETFFSTEMQTRISEHLETIDFADVTNIRTWFETKCIADEINYSGAIKTIELSVTPEYDNEEYRLMKFENEFSQYFNKEYCLVYFIMTELLLLYDSRGKNMMLASFGPNKAPVFKAVPSDQVNRNNYTKYYIKDGDNYVYTPKGYNSSQTYYENTSNYIWFPIFYDIDTQLGINNTGIPTWDYDEEATENGTFSTANSVLWANFYRTFKSDIIKHYRSMVTNSKLTYTNINDAYDCTPGAALFDQSTVMFGVRPMVAINLDAQYKYLDPVYKGYLNQEGKWVKDSGSFYYAAQGDRALSRELLIRNRLNYLSSKWGADPYSRAQGTGDTSTWMRINRKDLDTISDTWHIAGLQDRSLDSSSAFTMLPFLKEYVSVGYDDNYTPPVKFDGTNPVTPKDFLATTPQLDQSLIYLPGAAYISDFGDLSDKYIKEFHLNSAKRLTKLQLGSDLPGYKNSLLTETDVDFHASASEQKSDDTKGILSSVILTNLKTLRGTLDFSGAGKLNEFRALGTAISAVDFAVGAPLQVLHLPESVTSLTLYDATDLTHIFTPEDVDHIVYESTSIAATAPTKYDPSKKYYDTTTTTGFRGSAEMGEQNKANLREINIEYKNINQYDGLYIEHLFNPSGANVSKLTRLDLTNDHMGFDSYKLLLKFYEKCVQQNEKGYVSMQNVDWTPYEILENGYTRQAGETYYELTPHATYVVLNDFTDWDKLLLNGKIAKRKENVDYQITDLQLLKNLYNSSFFGTTKQNNKDGHPTLTGYIHISNPANALVDELTEIADLEAKYPGLHITADNVAEAHIAQYIIKDATGIEDVIRVDHIREGETYPNPYENEYIVGHIPKNSKFLGWSLTDTSAGIVATSDWNGLNHSNDLVLYAIFDIATHEIKFYNPDGARIEISKSIYPDVYYGATLPYPTFIPSYEQQGESLTAKQVFIGFAHHNSTVVIPQNEFVELVCDGTTDTTEFDAIYETHDVHENVLGDNELTFTYDENQNGYIISGKVALSGKITLPMVYNDLPVVGIDFKNNKYLINHVTHIFWEEIDVPTNMFTIYNNCFYSVTSALDPVAIELKYIEHIPTNEVVIGANAFYNCLSLFSIGTEELINYFFENVVNIGASAFKRINPLGTGNWTSVELPNINIIGNEAFANLPFVNIVLGSMANILDYDNFQNKTNIFLNVQRYYTGIMIDEVSTYLTLICYVDRDSGFQATELNEYFANKGTVSEWDWSVEYEPIIGIFGSKEEFQYRSSRIIFKDNADQTI